MREKLFQFSMPDLSHAEEDWQQCELGLNNAWESSIILHFQLSYINPLYIQEKQVIFANLIYIAEIGNSSTYSCPIYPT